MCVVFFNKIFSSDDGDFQYVSIDEAQAPSEQQFKAAYGVLIGETNLPSPIEPTSRPISV